MANSNTEHSRQLRAETATKRKQQIIEEGGHELRALLDKDYNAKLQALLAWYGSPDPISQRELVRRMIDREYKQLPINARLSTDQLDAFPADPQPAKAAGRPPVRYVLNGECWSGRGRKPVWVLDYLEAGGDLADIEIKATEKPK